MIEASANIGAQESGCVFCESCRVLEMIPDELSPPPPFIDKRRGGVHVWEGEKSSFLPELGACSSRLL